MLNRNGVLSKYFLIATCASVLSACSGGDNDNFLSGESVVSVNVAGSAGSETVDNTSKTDLTISGANNTVNIESDLRKLIVSGGNNILNFSDEIVVDSCTVTGSDNSVIRAGALTMECSDSGAGNIGF